MEKPIPQRILLTTDFKPMSGGIAEYLHNLWNYVADNCPATVFTPVDSEGSAWDYRYSFKNLPSIPERRLHRCWGDQIPLLRKIHTGKYFYDLKIYGNRLIASLKRDSSKPLQVYVGVWDIASHFWCRELFRKGIPYFLFAYGAEIVVPLYGHLPKWRSADFRRASGIFAVSRGTAALIQERFGQDLAVRVVNPGVGTMPDAERIREETMRLRHLLSLKEGNIILTVSRLVARKGIDRALESIAELKPQYPNLVYLVAGDGPERDNWRRLAARLGLEDRVRFLGQVDNLTKWALYSLCDVFIMPNRLLEGNDWEGFGIVFLEAALQSKPAIGGKNGGVPDAIRDGKTGFLVDPESRKEISGCLHRLLSDSELRRKMGEAAAQRARKEFHWERIAKNFLEDHAEKYFCVPIAKKL